MGNRIEVSNVIELKLGDGRLKVREHSRRNGNQYTWTRNYVDASKISDETPKAELPLLGLWNSSGHEHLVAADFDLKQIIASGRTPEQLMLELSCRIDSNTTLLVRSAGGGVKLLIRVAFDYKTTTKSFIRMNARIAARVIELTVGTQLFKLVDKSAIAMQVTYLSSSMCKALQAWLPNSFAEQCSHKFGICESHTVNTIVTHPHATTHRLYTLNDSQWLAVKDRLDIRFQANAAHKIIKILIATDRLLDDKGFALSQPMIAEQLGCSLTSVQRVFQCLKKEGKLIELTDKGYKPGVRAKSYKAAGLLAELIKLAKSLRTKKQPKQNKPLANKVERGTFNQIALAALSHFQRAEDFIDYMSSLPGFYDKRCRLRELKAIAKWHFSRRLPYGKVWQQQTTEHSTELRYGT